MDATATMEAMKGKKSLASTARRRVPRPERPIHDIVFACDAGMGSSAMGASVLRRKIQEAGFDDVKVVNKAISALTTTRTSWSPTRTSPTGPSRRPGRRSTCRSTTSWAARATTRSSSCCRPRTAPGAGSGVAEEDGGGTAGLLAEESVVLRGFASTRTEAITEAGELLVDVGAVDPSYLASMHEREQSVSTHMGNGLAIPHGTNDAKSAIRRPRSRSCATRAGSTGTVTR